MNTRTLLSIGGAVLLTGGVALGAATLAGSAAEAGTRSPAELAKRAAKALARHDAGAVALAEEAVAAAPGDAGTRAMLGRAYLQAGRFASARDAFGDALRLNKGDARSALNLALATTATGDWQGARQVLATYGSAISAADQGLALALAGDPSGAVAILNEAAREPGAGVKTRQNLALALALSGQWSLARAVAETDLSPGEVDRRMVEWARFAQPVTASDQVASLLGVTAVADQGQPVALALASPVAPAAIAPAAPVIALAAPVAAPPALPVQTIAQAIESAPSPLLAPAPAAVSAITFGRRREIVQPLPAPMIRRASGPIKTALAAPISVPAMQGDWHVQLGAFRTAAGAHDAWRRISGRHGGFDGHAPQGASYKAGGDALYRLSVGGFDRSGADRLCRTVRAGGGVCFVRRAAGDTVAAWARAGVQLAAR